MLTFLCLTVVKIITISKRKKMKVRSLVFNGILFVAVSVLFAGMIVPEDYEFDDF